MTAEHGLMDTRDLTEPERTRYLYTASSEGIDTATIVQVDGYYYTLLSVNPKDRLVNLTDGETVFECNVMNPIIYEAITNPMSDPSADEYL